MKKYILCLLFSLLLLTSCIAGGGSSTSTLYFTNYIGEHFEIKLHVERYVPNGHGGQFTSEKTLQEIQNDILEKNDCKITIYKDTLLIEKNINDMTQIGIISKYKNYYIFEQPHIIIFKPAEENVSEALFFAPSFYIDIERDTNTHDYQLFDNQWYKINCTEEEYMYFYKKTNMFIISEVEAYTVNVRSSVENHFDSQSSTQIEFKVENNSTYVKYSI